MSKNLCAAYNYDAMENVLYVSNAFRKKASQYDTTEYNTLRNLRNDNPNITIKEMQKVEKGNGLTYSKMEKVIGMCRDKEERFAVYKTVKEYSQIQPNPYLFVKKWFEDNYANWNQLALDTENKFVPKTKAEMEAEAKENAEQEANKVIDMPKAL